MCFCRAGRCAKQKQPSFFFLFLLLFLFFLLFSPPLFFLSPFSFRRGPSNALYPRATLQASLNTWGKAGFVVLLRATGSDVARRQWAPQLLPVLWQRAQVPWWYYRARDGSRSTLSALFRYWGRAGRVQNWLLWKLAGAYTWSCKEVFPSNHLPPILWGASLSSLALPPMFSWASQTFPYKTTSVAIFSSTWKLLKIATWPEGLLVQLKESSAMGQDHHFDEETRYLMGVFVLAQGLRQASPSRWRLVREHRHPRHLTWQLLDPWIKFASIGRPCQWFSQVQM